MGQGWEIGEESRVYFQLKLEIPVRHPMGDVEEHLGNKCIEGKNSGLEKLVIICI